MKKIIFIIAVAYLTGCGIYKPYQQPDVRTAGLFGTEYETTDSSTIANVSWREIFTDPELQVLIEYGIENNTNLQIAHWRVRQAEAALSTSRLAFLPSLHLAPEGSLSSFDGATPTKVYSVPVVASWEIDVFGKLQNAKKRSKAAYLQSHEYVQAVRTQLIATIANYYYTLLMLDAQYEISVRTAASWYESVEVMRAMKEAGMTNEAGVAQIEASYFAIEASVRDLYQQITEMENNLSILLGEAPQEIQRGTLAGQYFPVQLAVGVPLQLLTNRPDVKSAELTLVQAHYATNEARASLYPSITLAGSAGWTNSAGGYIVNPGKLLWSAAASLTQPLFNKGIHRAQVKIAEAQRQEAMLNFQQTLLNAGAEVNNALTQYQVAREKQQFRIQQITSLETAVESTELLMNHGSITYLDILTARQSLLSAQLNQVADKFSEIQSVVNLYHALGGGRDN
ncbi:MAG: TolC family protein [Tannerellaceae bacterium]|nr:TolC family protein [Tannerellaceae bacterium]